MNVPGWRLHALRMTLRGTGRYGSMGTGISPKMARRIEVWLGPDCGGRAELWLGMQLDYDLWVAEQKPAPKVVRAPELVSA